MHNHTFLETKSAGCKINLGLKITGTLENGYHTIDSIFWPLHTPSDSLSFYASSSSTGFSMSCNVQDIDITDNTLTKAHTAFLEAGGELSEEIRGLHVHLQKGIPHGAGLGGGSSDAACLLLWLNANAHKALSSQQLQRAALRVGADVPFFLENIPANVQGIGEIITPLEQKIQAAYSGTPILLLCPDVMISTPFAYAAWDRCQEEKLFEKNAKKKLTKLCASDKYKLACGNKQSMCLHGDLHNDFEAVIFETWPILAELKQSLLAEGAKEVIMSGSGSSMFGLMPSMEEAKRVAACFEGSQVKVFITTL